MNLKQLYKKIDKFKRLIYIRLFIYSFFGLFGLGILIGIGIDFLNEYKELIETYHLILESGEKQYADIYYSTVKFYLFIIPALYYLIFSLYALFKRFRLKRIIDKYGVDFSLTNSNLSISFNNSALLQKISKYSLLNIFAVLKLKNLTTDNSVVDIKLDWGMLKNNEIRFDLKKLDTGLYEIKSVKFFLHDYLRLIKCGILLNIDPPMRFTHIQDKQLNYSEQLSILSKTKLGEKSVMAQDAEEGFYANREYQWGDEVKKIHWKNTAKTNKIMVRIPEEVVLNKEDIVMVLNLYVPLLHKVDQQEQINGFLTRAVMFIEAMVKNRNQNTVLYINGRKTVRIDHLDEINIEKLTSKILQDAIFQSEQSFNRFLIENRGEFEGKSVLAISMSNDIIVDDSNVNLLPVIYKNSVVYSRPLLKKIKKNLTIPHDPSYVTLSTLFNVKSNRLFPLHPFLKPGLKRKIQRNEKFYLNKKQVIWLN